MDECLDDQAVLTSEATGREDGGSGLVLRNSSGKHGPTETPWEVHTPGFPNPSGHRLPV